MKDPRDYLTNFTPPSSGYSLGRLKDDPGDETGSGITVLTHNDFLYALLAPILKYKGAVSETDESETASDMLDALEIMAGLKNTDVNEWSAATTYGTLGTVVFHHGMQFINILNSGNTNKPPFENPTYWFPVPESRMLYRMYAEGIIQPGTLSPLHTLGGTYYQQTFSLGSHRFGGASGVVFNAYGIHLDGTTVVGGSTLATAVAAHWAKDIFAPEAVGVRTLKDLRECVIRSMGAAGGNAATLAEVQAAMMQDHGHASSASASGTLKDSNGYYLSDNNPVTGANNRCYVNGGLVEPIKGDDWQVTVAVTPSVTNPNSGSHGAETRGKSFVAGVPYVVAMVAA